MTNTLLDKQRQSTPPTQPSVALNGSTPSGLEGLKERVRSFVRTAGWDGFEAAAISEAACIAACSVISHLVDRVPEAPLPRVAPATDGAITLYWHQAAKAKHLTVAVYEDGRLEMRQKRTGERPECASETLEGATKRVAHLVS